MNFFAYFSRVCEHKKRDKFNQFISSKFIYYFFDSEVVTVAALIITLPNDITDIDASFKLEEFSENDYASVMALMAANRGKDSEPKVGLRRI